MGGISLTAKFLCSICSIERNITSRLKKGYRQADSTHKHFIETAYHESGHIIAGSYSKHPLQDFYNYVTIKPFEQIRSPIDFKEIHDAFHSNGYVKITDSLQELFSTYTIRDEEELFSAMVMFYGGMAAECEIFGDQERFEFGRSTDLANAEFLAEIIALKQIKEDDFIQSCKELMNSTELSMHNYRYVNLLWRKHCKSLTEDSVVENSVNRIMENAKNEAFHIVRANREKLDWIVSGLIEKGTLSCEEIAMKKIRIESLSSNNLTIT